MSERQPKSETIPSEQLENNITSEQIDQMDPRLAALVWENFLKLLSNAVPENEARFILFKDLKRYLATDETSNSVPSLDGKPKKSVNELKRYLIGTLDPERSRFSYRTLPELKKLNPNLDSDTDLKRERLRNDENFYSQQRIRVLKLLQTYLWNGDKFGEKCFERVHKILEETEKYMYQVHRYEKRSSKYREATAKLIEIEKEIRAYLKTKGIEIKEEN